ncbi:MAG: Fe-S cluster assembly protein SufD [Planctomycetota bacterium]|nr:MAG: Fe-S cluster assembly protein SufD [Planctomycetota bacterium]REJ95357.1 MAG: Fe-S cluster assembly protein SufD [Planctomycetota bacterium]REK24450.1 MAG: Fe-S cluster assembly protein SufD [Planctomycetota bacterium]REK38639.1 MAG: Fe-S cluster assembly protein SufD [Planctomycetota bacterium]
MTVAENARVLTGFGQAQFDVFLADRGEPDWLADRRRAAFGEYLRQLEAPLDPEEFKRLDLRTFRPERYGLVAGESSADAASFQTLMQDRAEFGGAVAHVDGSCVRSSLNEELAAQGVLFGDLAELLVSHRSTLEPHFFSAVSAEADRFASWHAAFWTGGTVLYVPRNVEIDVPLYSLIGLSSPEAADFGHTLVILEDGASATLLEETGCTDRETDGLHCGAIELIVGQGARLRYVQLQNWNHKVRHFARQCGRVARDGMLQWTVGGLGARFAHIHQDVHLDGTGAEAQVNGVTFATDRQLLSYYTQQSHNAADTRSDLLYKQVCRDRSRAVWRGMIKVEPEAQRTDGYQRNDALMMSRDARADAIPGLEIEADDVRCTHGATAGRVDEEQIFYAMCRGISRYEAMHMIVEGFFAEVYDRIPVELVRETLSQAVERKLGIGD